MLLIENKVKASPIHGVGLFTRDHLDSGQVIYTDDDIIKIDKSTYHAIPDKSWIDTYATVEYNYIENVYLLDKCNMRYINHSDTPNIEFAGNIAYTLREIYGGEELTCDYRKITTKEDFKNKMKI